MTAIELVGAAEMTLALSQRVDELARLDALDDELAALMAHAYIGRHRKP